MGVLKVIIEYSDQLVTYFLMLFLADLAYQFFSTVTFDVTVMDMDALQSILNFRPNLSKYISGYHVVKKIFNYFLSP